MLPDNVADDEDMLPACLQLLIPLYTLTPVMINSFHITSETLVPSYVVHTNHLNEA